MGLQAQIKKDLAEAMKAKDEAKKQAIRVILGEFGRMNKKDLSDDEVISVLKKLIKSEREVLEQQGTKEEDSEFIRVVSAYLPRMASEEEIIQWIKEHIDFSQFKNKMQAMRPIMSHFGSSADGNMVKAILQRLD